MNKEEIKRTIDILKPNGKLFEVRILGKYKSSGYFTNSDTLINELSKQNLDNHQVYITLNEINFDCYSRINKDKFVNNANSTKDDNITSYDWLFIDLDPERPSGISSTEEEVNLSMNKAKQIFKYLDTLGFKQPLIAKSGNGTHLLYRINLKNTAENRKIIENCLKALDLKFSEDKIKIDTANFNPSRICKLYGTTATKGANTPDRPHRQSKLVYVPKNVEITPHLSLVQLSKQIPTQDTINYSTNQFNLEDFIERYGIKVKDTVRVSQGTKYILEECIFNPEHKAPDSMLFQYSNGGIAYKCFHNSCQQYCWHDVKNKFEPTIIKTKQQYKEHYNPYVEKDKEQRKNVNPFFEIDNVRVVKTAKERSLSGFGSLDKLIGGFTYDSVTLWAAQTNAGKTTLLTMLTKSLIEQGRTVLYFNGEQTAENFKNNLYKQIADKKHIYSVEYGNTGIKDFYVSEEETTRIDNMIKNRLLIYNNEYDRDVDSLLDVMKQAREKYYCRDFIIDNLMQIDIAGSDVYREQERLTEKLRTFAVNNKCNIHLVAHSRKTSGNSIRLTMFDIAGTQNIANKSYNIITITRVDQMNKESEEYEKLLKDCANSGYDLTECDGVLEVLKTKGFGTGLVGLIYDPVKKSYEELKKKQVVIRPIQPKTKRIEED